MNILGLLVLVILLIIAGPIAVIWSLNTLFPMLAIPFTFKTWLAAFLLAGTLKVSGWRKSD